MLLYLYENGSPENKIAKDLSLVATLSGTLRGESNIVTPNIRITYPTVPAFNYAQIPEFSRYYFLRDIRQVRAEIWDLMLESDPLMSFNIDNVTGILTEGSTGGNNYLEHRNFVRLVKSKTDIIPFSAGLLSSGEYILITAGG